MITEEEATNQLAKIITTESEKVLSEKLCKHCLKELEDLRSLVNEFFLTKPDEYRFYTVFDNEDQFWNDNFFTPFSAIEAKGSHYNINDAYIYEGTDWLYYSCNDLSNFYSDQYVEELTHAIIRELKGNTEEETKQNLNYFNIEDYPQIVLLDALK